MDKTVIEQFLTMEEYAKAESILKRPLNMLELGLFSAMWSEHCSYKSSRKHLSRFPTTGDLVIQGPGENAGIVDIGDNLAVVFKMESHNHPSYIEPYQGAATGVGGILRDIFTMGARPIATLNSIRFGELDRQRTEYLLDGVVSGIADYGNSVGVPTVGGETIFDKSYDKNCLVNVFNVGLVKKDKIFYGKAEGLGNPIIYVGSATGKDGIHGASMASANFSDEEELQRPTVQVGDPFSEKLLIEACLELFKKDVVIGIQDMGAAGLTSSSFEMASRAGSGVKLYLDKIPRRQTDMTPFELMLSESQERMLVVTKKGEESTALEIFQKWGLAAAVVGEVTDDGNVTLVEDDKILTTIPAKYLVDSAPIYDRPYKESDEAKKRRIVKLEELPTSDKIEDDLLKLLGSPNLCSKEPIWSQYDYMVRSDTILGPGSDAAIIRIKNSKKAIAISVDCNSRYVLLDPYEGGKQAVAEATRNLAVSGGKAIAITNCLNFGSPEDPNVMWQFVRAIEGMSDAVTALRSPVVSGNVSFYNQTDDTAINPTPTVGAVGLIDDFNCSKDIYFKDRGDVILIIGDTLLELGGSEYLAYLHNIVKGEPPKVDLELEARTQKTAIELANENLVCSMHDTSSGGIAIALSESLFSSDRSSHLGFEVDFNTNMRPEFFLFSETQSRIIISAKRSNVNKIKELVTSSKLHIEEIGVVIDNYAKISINGHSIINIKAEKLRNEWEHRLKSIFEQSK